MQKLPHRGSRLLAGIALVALVSSACVKSDPSGVSISEVKTSAKFGFEESDKKLDGFDIPADSEFVGVTPLPDLPESVFTAAPKLGNKKELIGNPDCPVATNDVFPKDPATVQVKGTPTEGTYKWKRDAVIKINRANKNPVLSLTPRSLETRYIRGVTRANDHEFRFQMIAPDPFSPTLVVTSFLVNNNPAILVNERVDARTIGVTDIPGADVRVTPPQDAPGVFITKIENKDAKNNLIFAFSPVRPMLIIPLEEGILRTGQTFNSIGIDPTTGDVLMNDGTVGKTSEIDACGELIQGYSVSLDQTYTRDVNTADPSTEVQKYQARQLTRNLSLTFASQYGMLPIADNLSIGELSDATALVQRRSIGGLKVEPLPQSLK